MCSKCKYAENKEITKLHDGGGCPKCKGNIEEKKSIEVGNIFNQGTKYSEALGLYFIDESGNKKPVIMGAYGIGLSRVIGAIVEIYNDNKGIIWPESVAPFKIHFINLSSEKNKAGEIYKTLLDKGVEVLYDDRDDKSAGEKFADADLIGIPTRLVISDKTLSKNSLEIKQRNSNEVSLIEISKIKNAQSFI